MPVSVTSYSWCYSADSQMITTLPWPLSSTTASHATTLSNTDNDNDRSEVTPGHWSHWHWTLGSAVISYVTALIPEFIYIGQQTLHFLGYES